MLARALGILTLQVRVARFHVPTGHGKRTHTTQNWNTHTTPRPRITHLILNVPEILLLILAQTTAFPRLCLLNGLTSAD